MNERHDRAQLGAALHYARTLSKDPNTRVGAVIIGPGGHGLCHGYNGFPRLIADTEERLNNRELKNQLIVHAEMNAIMVAASEGIRLRGSTLYLAATDQTGECWGGPPCSECTKHVLQAGIIEIVSFVPKAVSKWHASLALAREMIEEAGITYREYTPVLNSSGIWSA